MSLTYPARRAFSRRRTAARRYNVLVVAPHPDDDVIGCGGTLVRLAARGARIRVVYVTDGSASHRKSRRYPPAVLRDIREGEASAALGILGIRLQPVFLRAPDGALTSLAADWRAALVTALSRSIAAHRTHIVFAPWLRDPHPDHVATAALVTAALGAVKFRPRIYLYGVWLEIRGDANARPRSAEAATVEVALRPNELARKRAAIAEHRSQTGELIGDDPEGFRIDAALLAQWLRPVERFYALRAPLETRPG